MLILKILLLALIVGVSSMIGILFSKKYINREKEIRELKAALSMFSTKIKFTYEPIPSLFMEIANKNKGNVGNIFARAAEIMKEKPAGEAWEQALCDTNNNFNKEDMEVIKSLSKMLGQTDIEGQISEIEVVNEFLSSQLEKAVEERRKNEKMYRTLGIVTGIKIAIILI